MNKYLLPKNEDAHSLARFSNRITDDMLTIRTQYLF